MINKIIKTVLFHVIGSTSLLLQTKYKNLLVRKKYNFFHEYHILDPSPWPFCLALSMFLMAIGLVIFFHFNRVFFLLFGIFQLIIVLCLWFGNIISESLDHTTFIRNGLKMGMILFIISEIMFFFSFFWGFFYLSVSPGVEVGCSWPPVGLQNILITPLKVPFLNTLILLCSGVTITYVHHMIDFSTIFFKKKLFNVCIFFFFVKKYTNRLLVVGLAYLILSIKLFFYYKKKALLYLTFTIILAIIFTILQVLEYYESVFFISDGAYGSTFFMMTGFHGFHVLIGSVLLLVCLFRLFFGHFDDTNYIGFEAAVWYWHFVDVVWLFLFIFIYIWGFLPRIGGFMIINEDFLTNKFNNKIIMFDFAKDSQINFQDPATKIASDLINLHHNLIFLLVLNLIIVVVLMVDIYLTSSDDNTILVNTNISKVSNQNEFKSFFGFNDFESLDKFEIYKE